MSRYGRKRISRRDMLKAAGALAAALAALGGGAYLLQRMDEEENAASAASYATDDHRAEAELKEIAYNGRTYRQRPDLETYLLMGVDTSGTGLGVNSYAGGGQADVQMVVVLDNANRTWQMLQLNRDSIVDVPVLDLKGTIIGYERQQLALAHAYGDGTNNSCQNTVDAVSMLLGDAAIDGYAALNMDGIAIVNDAIGGVTVTITSDFTAVDPTLVEGETITLNGQQAFEFVRTRKDVDDQTNLARMERQRVYLEAMKPQLMALSDTEVVQVMEKVNDYLVSNIGSQTVLDLAEKLKDYQELPELTIEGENTIEDGHWAYILNEDSLQRVILQLFYNEKAK